MPINVNQAIGTALLLKDPSFGRKGIVIKPDERSAEIDRFGLERLPFCRLDAVEDLRVDSGLLQKRHQLSPRTGAAAAVPDVRCQQVAVEVSAEVSDDPAKPRNELRPAFAVPEQNAVDIDVGFERCSRPLKNDLPISIEHLFLALPALILADRMPVQ